MNRLIVPDVRDCPAANYRCQVCKGRAMVITGNPREVIVQHALSCHLWLHVVGRHPQLWVRVAERLAGVSK